MNATNFNSASKMTTDTRSTVSKMDKLAKGPIGRTSSAHYQNEVSGIWPKLALGEVVRRSLYALTTNCLPGKTMKFFQILTQIPHGSFHWVGANLLWLTTRTRSAGQTTYEPRGGHSEKHPRGQNRRSTPKPRRNMRETSS